MKKTVSVFMITGLALLGSLSVWGGDENKIVPHLRGLAAALGWSQDIFVGVKAPGEEIQIYGIADISFQRLAYEKEKSYVQWLSASTPEPVRRAYEKHFKSYRRMGFAVAALQGLGIEAKRAYLVSYIEARPGAIALGRSQDALDILLQDGLITIRDDQMSEGADIQPIFRRVLDINARERFLSPFPAKPPALPALKDAFKAWPEEISLADMLPDLSGWTNFDETVNRRFAQVTSLARRYHFDEKGDPLSRATVRVYLFAYGSPSEALLIFTHYRNRARKRVWTDVEQVTKREIWIRRNRSRTERLLFVQGPFVAEVQVTWKDSRAARKNLAIEFARPVKDRIKKLFPG